MGIDPAQGIGEQFKSPCMLHAKKVDKLAEATQILKPLACGDIAV
ncbi:hypothetical protein ACQPYK_01455 [Streptosporangium sp. CA-135522]